HYADGTVRFWNAFDIVLSLYKYNSSNLFIGEWMFLSNHFDNPRLSVKCTIIQPFWMFLCNHCTLTTLDWL
ncbi:unnamed protein product, partial [Heterotrigona itama]